MNAPSAAWHVWLLALLAMSAIYDVVAYAAFRRWMKETPLPNDSPLEPISFFRPLKRGVLELRGKLETLLAASRPEDQIILGVDADSAEETLSEEMRQAHLQRSIVVVRCAQGRAINPKTSKLVQMESVARHAAWLLSDSEVIFSQEFLEGFRCEWQTRGGTVLTAAYRFVNLRSWPQCCDALGVLLALWPGLALVRRYGQIGFTLGACTVLRREVLAAVGGWGAFGSDLGEDQRLGAALAQAGHTIHLSRQVATLDSDPLSWRDYWRHQRRVAVTYRAANPAGFAGMVATYSPVASFVSWLVFRESWFAVVLVVCVLIRVWRIRKMSRSLEFSTPGLWISFGVASLVEALCWLLSWFPGRVWWSGRWWRVDFAGKLSRVE